MLARGQLHIVDASHTIVLNFSSSLCTLRSSSYNIAKVIDSLLPFQRINIANSQTVVEPDKLLVV